MKGGEHDWRIKQNLASWDWIWFSDWWAGLLNSILVEFCCASGRGICPYVLMHTLPDLYCIQQYRIQQCKVPCNERLHHMIGRDEPRSCCHSPIELLFVKVLRVMTGAHLWGLYSRPNVLQTTHSALGSCHETFLSTKLEREHTGCFNALVLRRSARTLKPNEWSHLKRWRRVSPAVTIPHGYDSKTACERSCRTVYRESWSIFGGWALVQHCQQPQLISRSHPTELYIRHESLAKVCQVDWTLIILSTWVAFGRGWSISNSIDQPCIIWATGDVRGWKECFLINMFRTRKDCTSRLARKWVFWHIVFLALMLARE